MKFKIIFAKFKVLALVSALGMASYVSLATAGEGHDHGGSAVAPNANGPQRLADGSVFLPKPAQRQLNVRTTVVDSSDLPRSYELNGRVLMDPNAGGMVQPMNAGRVEPGPNGLPSLGQVVKKGQVLAYVVPAVSSVDQSSQLAQFAEIRAAKSLAEKKLARLVELTDTVPRKEIEAAESELISLTERLNAINGGLRGKEALVAPVSGVIASANVVTGQVVDARELIFEVTDPKYIRLEALTFDSSLASNIGGATLALGEKRIPLQFIGAARSLRELALPLNFLSKSPELLDLAIGQSVKIYVQSKQKIQGIAVPQSALMKNAANQSVVWIKTSAEKFEPRTVTFEPLDGTRVTVTSGIKSSDRVATQGATLINQVR
jgi:multidrug efflux pump subunit AcrA (membrane-fusion protein)